MIRYARCARCRRRRRIASTRTTRDRWGNEYRLWRCSQGHTWRTVITTLSTVNRAFKRAKVADTIAAHLNAHCALLDFLLEAE